MGAPDDVGATPGRWCDPSDLSWRGSRWAGRAWVLFTPQSLRQHATRTPKADDAAVSLYARGAAGRAQRTVRGPRPFVALAAWWRCSGRWVRTCSPHDGSDPMAVHHRQIDFRFPITSRLPRSWMEKGDGEGPSPGRDPAAAGPVLVYSCSVFVVRRLRIQVRRGFFYEYNYTAVTAAVPTTVSSSANSSPPDE